MLRRLVLNAGSTPPRPGLLTEPNLRPSLPLYRALVISSRPASSPSYSSSQLPPACTSGVSFAGNICRVRLFSRRIGSLFFSLVRASLPFFLPRSIFFPSRHLSRLLPSSPFSSLFPLFGSIRSSKAKYRQFATCYEF